MHKAKIISFWAMPLFIFVFIVPQSALIAAIYDDTLSLLLLVIATLAITVYILAGGLAYRLFVQRAIFLQGARSWIFHGLLALYIGSYITLYVKHGGIPILELILRGGDAGLMRAEFTKNQEGFWRVFVYIISILNKGFIPIAVVLLHGIKTRSKFYLYLLLLTFIAISTLEKTLLMWAYIPILFYLWISKRSREFFILFLIALACFSIVSLSALRSELRPNEVSIDQTQSYQKNANFDYHVPVSSHTVSLSGEVEAYQFLLYDVESGNPLSYLLNRLIWIPYVTVYDTLLYWQETYHGLILFSVNRHLSSLFGLEFADLERNVFRFQFGSGEETTGNANAFYIAEAYVGFGFVGVILFSSLVGWMFGGICKMNMMSFICALPVVALGLISSSLISTLFSGGLAFFLLFAFLFSKPVKRFPS